MQLGSMSWKEFEGRLAARPPPAVLVPLGAVEAHGPHLPLETDTLIASRLAAVACKALVARGTETLCAPAVPLAAASWAADFPGTVSLPEEAERGLLWGVLRALGASGVARIGLVNLHFDPAHMRVVRSVVDGAREDGMAGLAFPDFTRRALAQRIGGEFATGACHGGSFETSLMLAVDPSLVGGSYKELPAVPLDLAAAIRAGKSSFREVGLPDAYCGDPARATASEGDRLFGLLSEIVVEVCTERWARMTRPPG